MLRAQGYLERRPTVIHSQNDTGGAGNRVVFYGTTGADAVTSNSAAGGNAGRPELAVPKGSAGGGGGGSSR